MCIVWLAVERGFRCPVLSGLPLYDIYGNSSFACLLACLPLTASVYITNRKATDRRKADTQSNHAVST